MLSVICRTYTFIFKFVCIYIGKETVRSKSVKKMGREVNVVHI